MWLEIYFRLVCTMVSLPMILPAIPEIFSSDASDLMSSWGLRCPPSWEGSNPWKLISPELPISGNWRCLHSRCRRLLVGWGRQWSWWESPHHRVILSYPCWGLCKSRVPGSFCSLTSIVLETGQLAPHSDILGWRTFLRWDPAELCHPLPLLRG